SFHPYCRRRYCRYRSLHKSCRRCKFLWLIIRWGLLLRPPVPPTLRAFVPSLDRLWRGCASFRVLALPGLPIPLRLLNCRLPAFFSSFFSPSRRRQQRESLL
ncbi:unnamed protein product, partial [Laminaria digitata]